MVKTGTSALARRARLIELIEAGLIHSQSDVVTQLKKNGFKVTQATASRDIEEIGAVRARNSKGQMIYQVQKTESVVRTNSNLILSVESSANLVVVKTPAGGAQLLASSLDRAGMKSVIGTIAGDDTVLVVSRKATGGAALAKELLAFTGMKKKGSK